MFSLRANNIVLIFTISSWPRWLYDEDKLDDDDGWKLRNKLSENS